MSISGISSITAATDRSGLVLVAASTFTTASTASLDSCFTSAYDDYRVTLTLTACSANMNLTLRFRAAGSDNSTANYARYMPYGYPSAASGGTLNGTGLTAIGMPQSATANAAYTKLSIDVFSPQAAVATGLAGQFLSYDTTSMEAATVAGFFAGTTQFDGLSFYPSTGTMTGTVRVYGYRNNV